MDISTLKDIELFEDLNDTNLEDILKVCKSNHYKKDNIILFEEDLGNLLFFIIAGKIKISKINEAGKEIILSMIEEGDYFGEMSILDGEVRSANAIALSDTTVCIITKQDFYSILEKHPKVTIRLLKNLTTRLRKADKLIENLSLNNAKHRICNTILTIAENTGIHKNGIVTIKEIPRQEIIANMSGTSRETVSRMFSKLKTENLIRIVNRELIIDDYKAFLKKFSTN